MHSSMPFRWSAVLLAPAVIPLLFSIWDATQPWGGDKVFGFFFDLALSGIVSYGTTIVLFLPSLFALSRRMRVDALRTTALGTLLGGGGTILIGFLVWSTSGANSGPPEHPRLADLLRTLRQPGAYVFVASGLVTSWIYWILATSAGTDGSRPKNWAPPSGSSSP